MEQTSPLRNPKRNWSNVSLSSTPSPASKIPNRLGTMSSSSTPEMENISAKGLTHDELLTDLTKMDHHSDNSLHKKMDLVITLLQSLTTGLNNNKEVTDKEIQTLKQENSLLKVSLAEAKGRVHRMEKDINILKSQNEGLQVRSISQNILIHNVDEVSGEDLYKIVHDFFKQKLQIAEYLVHSDKHPAAPVQIDIVHRLGKPGARARPIVIKLVLRRGKDIILKHARNLKGSKIYITEQLPKAMNERRSLLVPDMRRLHEDHKGNKSYKVVLSKDQLLVNNSPIMNKFKMNSLSSVNSTDTPTSYDTMLHTEVTDHRGSFFQGHFAEVHSIEDAKAAYSALFQNHEVAKADHIMYAYSITAEEGTIVGNDDDGEYGGSAILRDILNESSLTNCLVAVSRIHSGPNLGKKRFQFIESCARKVIELI